MDTVVLKFGGSSETIDELKGIQREIAWEAKYVLMYFVHIL